MLVIDNFFLYLGKLYKSDEIEGTKMRMYFNLFLFMYKGLDMAMYLSMVTDNVKKADPTLKDNKRFLINFVV